MVLRSLEQRLERMVEGVFSRAFRSGLRPIELGRRLLREMDDHRSVDVRGRTIVPNEFTFRLSPHDHANFADIADALTRELADAAREYARDEGYAFMGPVTVNLRLDEQRRPGQFIVESKMHEGVGGTRGGSLLLPSGDRVQLGPDGVTIGRLPDCTIPLADPNVSRRHAEVRPLGAGFAVVDLQSTNGTFVNGIRITQHPLDDGDVITVGATRIVFQAS